MELFDISIILRKIAQLELYQKQIQEYSEITVGEYKEDWKKQRIIERTLQMMIETCADIANHIISSGNMRVPGSYADIFRVLNENKIIGEELFRSLEKMSKFRNILVHQYEQIEAEIVVTILKKYLGDFDRFKDEILKYLKTFQK